MTKYADIELALAPAALEAEFGTKLQSVNRLGKRAVACTKDGVFMLSGPQSELYWALLPQVTT